MTASSADFPAQDGRAQVEPTLTHLHDALGAARERGDARHEAPVLRFLGIAYRELGDLAANARLLGESLGISRRYADRYPEVLSTLVLAKVYLLKGDLRARSTVETALAVARECRMSHHVADGGHARRAGVGGRVTRCRRPRIWGSRWRSGVPAGWLSFLVAALTGLGRALRECDPPAARKASREVAGLYWNLDDDARHEEVTQLLTVQ